MGLRAIEGRREVGKRSTEMKAQQTTMRSVRQASLALLLGLLSSSVPALAQDIKSGLKAYWNFDQKNYEDAVGIFDGTENGSSPIAFEAGKAGFGQSIHLDGTDQFVEITGGEPDDLAFEGGSVSISTWFKVDVFDTSWQALVAKGEGSNWRIARNSSSGTMSYAGGLTDATGTIDVSDGAWHHIVAISDAAGTAFGTAIYVDGQLDGQIEGAAALAVNGARVMIGENPGARGREWAGSIDDVAIWDRVLTESEIASLWAGGAGKPLSAFFAPPNDADNDGMPNEWETQYGLNPNDPADAALDPNANGITNLDEYKAGYDPRDTVKPTITAVKTTGTFDSVTLTFSKPLDPATATNAANYAISPTLAITGVSLRGTSVTLTTAAQAPGATGYTVTVNNVKSVNLLTIVANTKAKFYSYQMTKNGVLKFSYWTEITGTPVDNLYSDPRYPASPTGTGAVYSFNSRDYFPTDALESYGATLEGFITPAESGDYRFFVYSDDASQLFLSTDDKEANLTVIAEEPSCCNNFTEPDGTHTRTSEPIALVAGKKYFVRLVYKEGTGGDYGQVAWRKEGDKTPAGSLRPIPGKFLSSVTDLPFPSEGIFSGQTPAANAKGVAPNAGISLSHTDGKTEWTAANVTFKLNGVAITPVPLTKVGADATISYQPTALFPSKTKNIATVIYRDAGNVLATNEWSFEVAAWQGPILDSVQGYPGLIIGAATQTPDKGGRSGSAGDLGMDFGSKGGAAVLIPDASWLNSATAADELTFSLWIKRYDINGSSAFWAASPSSTSTERGWQAHVPWSDDNIYFDTAGCCDAATQRINAHINTFAGYSGDDTWWNQWRHFVFKKKGDQKDIYIDGQLFLNGSSTSPLPTDFTRLYLGCDSTGAANFMHGAVDDFAVYGTALAEADIKKLAAGTVPNTLGAGAKLMALWDFNAPVGAPASVTDGLVAYWSFDGNLQDSIKDHHGSPKGTNAIAYVDREGFGKAIKLDGTDQYVDITGGSDDELEFPGGSMSIAGWFKVDAFDTDWQALIAKGENNNYRIARRGGAADGNGIAYAGGAGEGPSDIPPVNDGLWHHFVAISDASPAGPFGTALYVDGILHSVQSAKPTLTANTQHLFIGENPEALGRQWNGEIDDIGIWGRVLNPTEVAALWNSGAGKPLSSFPAPSKPLAVSVSRSGANLTIQWSPAGGSLESSPTIGSGATWTPVGVANPATVAIGAGNLYYRVRQ
jgi:hypothetical protein